MHSVMNSIFATPVLQFKDKSDFFIYEELSKSVRMSEKQSRGSGGKAV
jgi:hypothetical protein